MKLNMEFKVGNVGLGPVRCLNLALPSSNTELDAVIITVDHLRDVRQSLTDQLSDFFPVPVRFAVNDNLHGFALPVLFAQSTFHTSLDRVPFFEYSRFSLRKRDTVLMPEVYSSPEMLALALAIGLAAGIVKGIVGFALPIILVSGLSTFVSPHAALAGVVVPAVVTNLWLALRQGPGPAFRSTWKIRRFLAMGILVLLASAQLVPKLSDRALLLTVSIPIILFSAAQLFGWRPNIQEEHGWAEYLAGVVFGLFSGLAAVFAPALVLYLSALGTQKTEQVRIQGVVFSVAASFFCAAHLYSGVLTLASLIFSTVLLVPSLLGMWIGFRLHDSLEQNTFRMLTLVVLLLSGLNLLRKALVG